MDTRVKIALVGLVLLYACGGEPAERAGEEREGAQDTTAPDTTPMPSMPGPMQGMPMMGDMAAHMQAMENMPPDSIRAMMPRHRQMADSAFAQMEAQMRAQNMTPDPRWTATVDSLRQDMARMQNMSDTELRAFMPAHRARMQRLMEMQRSTTPAPR